MAAPPIHVRLGRRVRLLRTEANVSQEALAHRCRVSRTYLSQLEAGNRNPSLAVLERLAMGLKIQLRDLLDL